MADPAFDLASVDLYVGRTTDLTFDLYGPAGEPLVITAQDNVRAKLWAEAGEAPEIDADLTSTDSVVTAISLGVVDTTPARVSVRFHQDDLALLAAGDYSIELLLVDDDDDGVAKPICRMPATLHGSPLGDVD